MKKNLVLFSISVLILAALVGCSDSLKKVFQNDNAVRVEYSSCVGAGCHECVEEFNCPVNAIRIDPRTTTTYIDTDKCIQCLRCVSVFQCPEAAITTTVDNMAPAEVEDFTAVSDTTGELRIEFTATGDDGNTGRAFRYDMEITDQNNTPVQTDFEPPLPLDAGDLEEWLISGLPGDQLLNLSVTVWDENDLSAPEINRQVMIQGEYVDDIPPDPVSDLVAITGTDFIEMSWTAPGDDGSEGTVSGYEIRYNTDPVDAENWSLSQVIETEIIPLPAGSLQQIEIIELPLLVEFYFGLKAYDEENNFSEVSNSPQAMITGDITPPDPVTDLLVGSVSSGTILITWTAVGDDGMEGNASEYIIKISDQQINESNWDELEEYPNSLVPQPPGSMENFLLDDLIPETGYYAALKAVDENQNQSGISNVVYEQTTEIPDEIPPAAVEDLESIATEYEIILNWTAPGDDGWQGSAYAYDLRRSTQMITESNWDQAAELSGLPVPSPAGESEEFIDTNVEQDEDYFYALKTLDEAGNSSDLSNVTQNSLVIDTIPPAQVTDLTAVATEFEIILNWTAPGDDGMEGIADHYDLRRHLEPITDLNWDDAQILPDLPEPAGPGSEEVYIDLGAEPGILYYYALKTYDNAGNGSEMSNLAENTLLEDQTPPGTIVDLAVIEGYVSSYYTIQFMWTAPGDDGYEGTAAYYELRQSTQPINEQNWEDAETVALIMDPEPAGSSESFELYPVEEGVIFYFAIRAFDENENVGDVSNSPGGKIVYQINAGPCNGCGNCVYHCDENAITDHGNWASIDPERCVGCGDCVYYCPRNAIHMYVVSY